MEASSEVAEFAGLNWLVSWASSGFSLTPLLVESTRHHGQADLRSRAFAEPQTIVSQCLARRICRVKFVKDVTV